MNAVLGNSKRVVAQLQKDEKVSEDKLGLIYNGVAIRPMSKSSSGSKIRNETGANLDSIVFIIVANLKPCKGHQDLLNAMSIINEELTLDWRLLIVGRDDGIRESLKTQASLLRVSRNVCFLGARSDVHELFSASDVGILCSHEEGFSNALLEGMAAGLPMVVTDVGGNSEAVIDEKTGLVVPPRDPSKLGEAILRLANDNELRKRMGEAGRKRVEEHFPLDKCVDNYVRLYECLLDGGDVSDVPELQAVIT